MNNTMNENKLTESDRIIHTPSSYARRNLIFAQETGYLKSLKEHSCTREKLESYLFFIVLEGRGTVITGGKEYRVENGDAVLLDCRKLYTHRSDANDPWKIRWVHFNGNIPKALFELFCEGNGGNPVFTPSKGVQAYSDILDRLEDTLKSDKQIAEIYQSHVLEELMISTVEDVVKDKHLAVLDDTDDHDNDDFATLREAVNEHIGETNLEILLSIQYGLKPEQLSELFEKKYGISLSDYIINRKLNKAKELLRFTIKSVDEILYESGFENQQQFRDLFLESEEMSPEDYRKRWAQWVKS